MKRNTMWVTSIIAGAALLISACADDSESSPDGDPASTIEVEETPSPEFEARDIDPVTPSDTDAPVEDEGLGVTWTYQGARSSPYGGTVITIELRNDNDMALPTDAVDDPTLETGDGNDNYSEVSRLDVSDSVPEGSEYIEGLDLPLGAGATTNLQYTFDTTPGALWDARLSIGNIILEGNLSN